MPPLLKQGPATGAGAIELSPEGFARVFPFHFACDSELVVTQGGGSLLRMAADLRPGARLPEVIDFKRPSGEFSSR